MIILLNILMILFFTIGFFLIRMKIALSINNKFAIWAVEELDKRIGTKDIDYPGNVYLQFSPEEFIFRKINCWDFKSVLEYCKQKKILMEV